MPTGVDDLIVVEPEGAAFERDARYTGVAVVRHHAGMPVARAIVYTRVGALEAEVEINFRWTRRGISFRQTALSPCFDLGGGQSRRPQRPGVETAINNAC